MHFSLISALSLCSEEPPRDPGHKSTNAPALVDRHPDRPTISYGSFRITTSQFRDGPRLALLQSNIPQELKNGRDWEKILEEFKHLVEIAVRKKDRPDLIVWPETSYPYGYISIDPSVTTGALQDQIRDSVRSEMTAQEWIDYGRVYSERIQAWADAVNVPMLVGCLYYDHKPAGELRKYNSAILFEPMAKAIQFYHKIHLVPFGSLSPSWRPSHGCKSSPPTATAISPP